MVRWVRKAMPVPPVPPARRVMQVPPASPARKAIPVPQVLPDPPVRRGMQAPQVLPVRKAMQALLVRWVRKVLPVLPAPRVRRGMRVPQVPRVPPERVLGSTTVARPRPLSRAGSVCRSSPLPWMWSPRRGRR